MVMVFAQRMEMILRGPIGPHTVLWVLNDLSATVSYSNIRYTVKGGNTQESPMRSQVYYIHIYEYCTNTTAINLSAFVYRLFVEDFISIVESNLQYIYKYTLLMTIVILRSPLISSQQSQNKGMDISHAFTCPWSCC